MNDDSSGSARSSAKFTLLALAMLALWCALWVAYDWWQAQPHATFFLDGVPLFAWYALALLVLSAFLSWRLRPTPTFGVIFALVCGMVPILLMLAAAAPYLADGWLAAAAIAAGALLLLYMLRGLRAITGRRQAGSALAATVLVAGFVLLSDALDVVPDVWQPQDAAAPQASTDAAPADQEALLFAQSALIDASLAPIARPADSGAHSFFLGFAGVGDEKVFAQEIDLAAHVIGRRFDVGTRSLALINDERDLHAAPLASVAALGYALRGLAAKMDRDRDVLFLAISSHGSEDPAIAVANASLPLDDLTDTALADALQRAHIKWRVIIISACYAGGFIERLKNAQSIIITAAAADRTSFGCGSDSDLTYFGEAFYRDALPHAHSLREAFGTARAAIAGRERRERVEPSDPQAYFGVELEAKLHAMYR